MLAVVLSSARYKSATTSLCADHYTAAHLSRSSFRRGVQGRAAHILKNTKSCSQVDAILWHKFQVIGYDDLIQAAAGVSRSKNQGVSAGRQGKDPWILRSASASSGDARPLPVGGPGVNACRIVDLHSVHRDIEG